MLVAFKIERRWNILVLYFKDSIAIFWRVKFKIVLEVYYWSYEY